MALEVFFKGDIANGIACVTVAMLSASMAHGGTNVEYCRGVMDSARAQAVNYGLDWRALLADMRGLLQVNHIDVGGLLEG